MGDARVRGWRKSQRHIEDIAESAVAGKLKHEFGRNRRLGVFGTGK